MKINRIWREVNSSGTLNSEVKEIINYIEDCTYDEERQNGNRDYTNLREVGEIFKFKKNRVCYLTYRIVSKNEVKGGLIKFDASLLPRIKKFLRNYDTNNWIRLIIGEEGGKYIWTENEYGVVWKDEEECRKLDRDVFSNIYKKMSLIKTLSDEWGIYYLSLEFLTGRKILRRYSLLNETNTNEKDREYLLKYHEEDDCPEYNIQEGTIYKEGGYCYLDCGLYPYASSDPSYETIRFDESLVPEIYQLCKNENQTLTIYDYINRKGGKCIRWQHSKYYIWEDEEVYGPHDPNDPRYNYPVRPIETIYDNDKDVVPLPF